VTLRVIITPNAEDELRAAYRYIRDRAPDAARGWVKGARTKIKSLAHDPERAPLAPESVSFENPIRELFYGSGNRGTYRILFTVLGQQVYVLHFRHGSMSRVDPDE
jgi:plasmid stabilization system protein ParE